MSAPTFISGFAIYIYELATRKNSPGVRSGFEGLAPAALLHRTCDGRSKGSDCIVVFNSVDALEGAKRHCRRVNLIYTVPPPAQHNNFLCNLECLLYLSKSDMKLHPRSPEDFNMMFSDASATSQSGSTQPLVIPQNSAFTDSSRASTPILVTHRAARVQVPVQRHPSPIENFSQSKQPSYPERITSSQLLDTDTRQEIITAVREQMQREAACRHQGSSRGDDSCILVPDTPPASPGVFYREEPSLLQVSLCHDLNDVLENEGVRLHAMEQQIEALKSQLHSEQLEKNRLLSHISAQQLDLDRLSSRIDELHHRIAVSDASIGSIEDAAEEAIEALQEKLNAAQLATVSLDFEVSGITAQRDWARDELRNVLELVAEFIRVKKARTPSSAKSRLEDLLEPTSQQI